MAVVKSNKERSEPAVRSMCSLSVICSEEYIKDIPVMSAKVSAGEPTEVGDDIESYNQFPFDLFSKVSDSYIVQVQGNSMIDANIEDGDFLLVDQSLAAENGHIVIVKINGEMTVKRFVRHDDSVSLIPENSDYESIEATKEDELNIFGVVTRVIKNLL